MKKTIKSAILLLRVSTDKQFYESQEHDLKIFAKEKGFNKFKIISTKETGFTEVEDKIGTNEMFQFISENPEYNTVFCTELSRIGRTQIVLHQVRKLLIDNQIQLYIKDSGYQLFKENGKLDDQGVMSFTIFALMCENEVAQKKLRFARKKRQQMEEGDSYFGGKVLFGYKLAPVNSSKNAKNKLVINEEEAKLVEEIFNLYLYGFEEYENPSIMTVTRYCIKNGKHKYTHSKRNVTKLLHEQGYTGLKISNNKRINPNKNEKGEKEYIITSNTIKYPKIIDYDTFMAVKEKLKNNRYQAEKKTKRVTILKGLIKCTECGKNLQGDFRWKNKEIKHSYRCTSRHYAIPCKNKSSYSMMMLDGIIWGMIKTDKEALFQKIKEINPNIEYLQLLNQEKNLNDKLKEVEQVAENIILGQSKKLKLKNINYSQLIEDENLKLSKLDKEITKLKIELETVKKKLHIAKKNQNNINNVLTNNVFEIEKDAELIKKYINIFIKNIKIIYHDRLKTILLVNFKFYTPNIENKINLNGVVRYLDGLSDNVVVVIDKKNTINPIARKDVKEFTDERLLNYIKIKDFDKSFEKFNWERLKNLYEK